MTLTTPAAPRTAADCNAPSERAAVYDAMNATLARLHSFDPAALGLADFGRGENYVARQVERWSKQYRASETERIEEMERLIAWLPAQLPLFTTEKDAARLEAPELQAALGARAVYTIPVRVALLAGGAAELARRVGEATGSIFGA